MQDDGSAPATPTSDPSAAQSGPPRVSTPEGRALSGPEGLALFRYVLFTRTPRVRVTQALVGLNVAVFLAMVATGVSLMQPSTDSLLRWGADYGPRTTAGEWWRLLTNTFLHVGLIHIAMNMFGLWQIGAVVERLLGHRAFLLVYLVSGVCGSLASIIWHPYVVSAGASGAVFGVYGVLVAYLVRHRGSIPRPVLLELQKSTAIFIGLNVMLGWQVKGIDMAAHLGGLLGGFAAALVVSRPLLERPARHSRANWWREAVVAAAALGLVGAAVLLLPRALDVQSELREFQRVEQTAIDAYNGGVERRGAGKLSNEGLADLVDRQVLPPWRAYLAHLRTLKALPPQQARWIDDLTRYLELRAQAWAAFSDAARTGNPAKSQEAQRLEQQVETLMKEQSAQGGRTTKSDDLAAP
ncbi:MAG: rhomboid family intramembrane serine protease [Myxococcales bacterium]